MILEYFSITSMNTPLRTLTQLHISLVVDPDIWKLLQNLKTIAGVIMENSSGMISNRFLELVSDWLIYKQFETL